MLPEPPPPPWSLEQARDIGEEIGIIWDEEEFSLADFHEGLRVELEHGTVTPMTNVTDDCAYITGRIALAHLMEHPRYYQALQEMEDRLHKGYWGW